MNSKSYSCFKPCNMPQQRQVYGKSKAAFQISSCFGSDSPAKPRKKQSQLSSKSLQEVKARRRPLQDVDLNSRLQALSLNDSICKPVVAKVPRTSGEEATDTLKQDDALYGQKEHIQRVEKETASETTENSLHHSLAGLKSKSQEITSSDLPDLPYPEANDSVDSLEQKDYTYDLSRLKTGGREAIESIQPFTSWGDAMQEHFDIEKIAEATYGEVYRLKLNHSHPTLSSNDESVLKVIALQSPTSALLHHESTMSTTDSVINEVQLLQRMTLIPGFVNFRDVSVLRGRPGKFVSAAWKAWNKGKSKDEKSQFPDPSRKNSYADDQLWAVIEMQDAGTDLEKVELPTIFHVWDVFWSVALSLAKAEEECRFEHRDLHLGNICVRNASGCSTADAATVRRPPFKQKVGYTTLETTIIDYTLSRADLGRNGQSSESDDVAFFDLSRDSEIFGGNAEDDYQYEVYRMMRSIVTTGDPVQHLGLDAIGSDEHLIGDESQGNWRDHHALTNLLWLHYILETMLNGLESRSGANDQPECKGIQGKETAALMKSALKLEKTLRAIRSMLKAEKLSAMAEDGLASAADLVWLALEEKWLTKADVQSSTPNTC